MIVTMPTGARAWTYAVLLTAGGVASAADPHFARPVAQIEQELAAPSMQLVAATLSRPKAKGDATLRAEVSFGDAPAYRVKLRVALPGADAFNNSPRYDLAAYQLQKAFLDPTEYVVPPTALRMIPLAQLLPHVPSAIPTFPGSDDVLAVVQYWLQDVTVTPDAYDAARFAADPVYARHIGQLNLFTYLIRHSDSNLGNILVPLSSQDYRVFAVDNNVAFGKEEGDRGMLWRDLRVDRLPADAVERLRRLDKAQLRSQLAVLAQWELRDGHYLPLAPGPNLAPRRGVRTGVGMVQLGLTSREIHRVWERTRDLLRQVDRGDIRTF